MNNTQYPKDVLVRRMQTITGHVKKIMEMIEDKEYCIDVLQQTTAVKNAIRGVEMLLLDNHLHSCVIRDIKKGKKKSVDELLLLFKKTN